MLSQGLWRRMVIGGSGVLLWVAPVSIYGLRWSVARLRPWLCILAVALRHTYNGRHPCLGMGYVREGGEGGGGDAAAVWAMGGGHANSPHGQRIVTGDVIVE